MKIHPRLDRLKIGFEGFRPEARAAFRHALECESCREALLLELDRSSGPGTDGATLAWRPESQGDVYGKVFEHFLADFERHQGQEVERRREAEALVEELLEMSSDQREVVIGADPAFHCLRVGSGLLKRSRSQRMEDPREAEALARLAVKIADHLSPVSNRQVLVEDLRLRAWIYVGSARLTAGDVVAAAEAIRLAEVHQAGSSQDVAEMALLVEAKAMLNKKQGRLEVAERLFSRASDLFREVSDQEGVHRTALNLAHVYNLGGRLDDAITLLRATLDRLDEERSPRLGVFVRNNLAATLVEAGKLMEAQALLVQSRKHHEKWGDPILGLRRRWTEARLALATGRPREAEEELLEVRQGFLDAGIGYDAALASLEIALLYLDRGDSVAARELAAEMVPIFEAQDVHRQALAALAVFQRAAGQERLSRALVAHIRTFLESARGNPSLRYEPLAGSD